MTLALIKSYELTGNKTYLDRAATLFDDVMGAWDTTCCGSTHGGIWWDKGHTQKATASNGGPVIASLLLNKYYGTRKDYKGFASQVYTFWYNNMVNHTTFQVCDNIDAHNGEKRWWVFTYNGGLMLGASVLMYQTFMDPRYLVIGKGIADFILTHETTKTQDGKGPILFDGAGCSGDCNEFKGITFRYLALYLAQVKTTSLYQVMQTNADSIWDNAKTRGGNQALFGINWAGPPLPDDNTCFQSQQNSAVMALNIFADLYRGTFDSDAAVLTTDETA